MKKWRSILLVLATMTLVSGCTAVRIDTDSIDNTINVILSKDNTLYNRVGKGYKYYVPRGVNYIDTDEFNDKLYSNGNYYYLYIDAISYYYKEDNQHEYQKDSYYKRDLDINGKKGYVEILKLDNKQYYVEFMYNYAKIEAIVNKSDINEVILNASYILSTVKFNDNVIRIMLDDDYFINKEEKYDIFEDKNVNDTTTNFLDYNDEEEK
ncbi:MAG: hypothetical protein V8Q75_01175 [Bacilli bacterium]